MRFRPCIDIHNGAVKQIVGSSIRDGKESVRDNFVSDKDAAYYAGLYKKLGLYGGHIAILNRSGTPEYEAGKKEAVKALNAFRGGMQAGGGVNAENAGFFIKEGASHVIVTSYIFEDGRLRKDRLEALCDAVGKEHVVLDLSCRLRDERYYVVCDRWQRFTEEIVEEALFERLGQYCDEFLVHGVDVEGKKAGLDKRHVELLSPLPFTITYAGGISRREDVEVIKEAGGLDFTVGSALKIFGGSLELTEVVEWLR